MPAGFFVELWYEPVLNEVVQVRYFVRGESLAAWAGLVRLPEEWLSLNRIAYISRRFN